MCGRRGGGGAAVSGNRGARKRFVLVRAHQDDGENFHFYIHQAPRAQEHARASLRTQSVPPRRLLYLELMICAPAPALHNANKENGPREGGKRFFKKKKTA